MSSNKHTDEEFKQLAIDHNNLYAAFKQRGEEIERLKTEIERREAINKKFFARLNVLSQAMHQEYLGVLDDIEVVEEGD